LTELCFDKFNLAYCRDSEWQTNNTTNTIYHVVIVSFRNLESKGNKKEYRRKQYSWPDFN
jgi:hypothetical protein